MADDMAGEIANRGYGARGPFKLSMSTVADGDANTIECWFRSLEAQVCKDLQTTKGFNALKEAKIDFRQIPMIWRPPPNATDPGEDLTLGIPDDQKTLVKWINERRYFGTDIADVVAWYDTKPDGAHPLMATWSSV